MAYICTCLHEVRGIAVAQAMNTRIFIDVGFFECRFKHILRTSNAILPTILAFEEVFFGAVFFEIVAQLVEDAFG